MQSGKDIMFLKPQTPKPHLRLASEIDCIYLSENLRKEDIQEIQTVTGLPPLLSLLTGLKMSSVPLVICNADCKPVAMLGVVPNGLIGFIWMVGTDDLKKISLSFFLFDSCAFSKSFSHVEDSSSSNSSFFFNIYFFYNWGVSWENSFNTNSI